MTDVYGRIWKRIETMRNAGVEPDKVVVGPSDFDKLKEKADVRTGEGNLSGDATEINRVRVLWNSKVQCPEIIVKVDEDDA